MAYTASPKVNQELIEKLLKCGALVAEENGLVDARLNLIVPTDARIRKEIALPFFEVFCRAYHIRHPQRMPIPFGIIRVTGSMDDVGVTLSDMASNTTNHPIPLPRVITKDWKSDSNSRINIGPLPDYRYALIDDISKGGETIIHWLIFWLTHGFKVNQVVVFTDRGAGGIEHIREEARKLNESRKDPIEVTCLVNHDMVISAKTRTTIKK